MSFISYIRKAYNVPAKRGMSVLYGKDHGRIVGASGTGHLRIRFFKDLGRGAVLHVHPTDPNLKYLDQPCENCGASGLMHYIVGNRDKGRDVCTVCKGIGYHERSQ